MLSAASAAGVSVAFAAPIGGVLFSLEEVSYYFPSKTMWRSFFCALISTVTIRLINPLGTGQLVLFQVSYSKDWHAFEFLPFLALGIFGGLYGAFFIHVSTRFAKLRSRLFEDRVILEVVLVAALTGVANWLNPFTRIGNSELVAYLFSECKHELDYQGLCM